MKLKKLALIILLIATGATTLLVVKKLLISKQKWIKVQILSMAGSWWWQSPAAPVWLAPSIKPGDQELSFTGRPIAEISKIESWPVPDNNSSSLRNYAASKYLVTAKIKVSSNSLSKKIWFKDNPIAIGQPIVLEINNILFNGNILWLEGHPRPKTKIARIQLILYHRYPWEIQTIKNNSPLTIDSREIFKINRATASPTSLEWLEKGRLVRRSDLVDIIVTATIQTEIINNEPIFLKEQRIKTGKDLFVPLDNHDLDGAKIKAIKWLD